MTADILYFGTGKEIPDQLAEAGEKARQARSAGHGTLHGYAAGHHCRPDVPGWSVSVSQRTLSSEVGASLMDTGHSL